MLTTQDLGKGWVVTLGVAVLHTAILAGRVGYLRNKHKTYANKEDAAKNGGTFGTDHPEVVRGNSVHRNQLENLPLFIGASAIFYFGVTYAWLYSGFVISDPSKAERIIDRDASAGIALFAIWVFTRLVHTFCFVYEIQPWRSRAYQVGLLTIITMVLYPIIRTLSTDSP